MTYPITLEVLEREKVQQRGRFEGKRQINLAFTMAPFMACSLCSNTPLFVGLSQGIEQLIWV